MRKISLFIAMSLDGYIADSNGGVDWLKGQGDDNGNIDTYSGFVKDIDTVLMGWNTYHQIVTELSPTEWVYSDFRTYVITHTEHISTEKIHFTNVNPINLLKELKAQIGSGIRLFKNRERELRLKLLKTQTYNGITDLVYTRK